MPTIFTNPPAGIALMPYSVSPRVIDHSVGPKPTKNFVALNPSSFAAMKWPASWIMITTSSATMNRTMPRLTCLL
jgi:hypothetical protein